MKLKLLARILTLCLFSVSSFGVFGQTIDITFAPTPTQVSRCGPTFDLTVTVTNNTGQDTTDITGQFTLRQGVYIDDFGFPDVDGNGVYDFGDLAIGESVTFTAIAQVGCDFGGQTFSVDFSVEEGGSLGTSSTLEVIQADLSVPTSDPQVFGVFLGLEDNVDVQVVNASFGEVEMFEYCVVRDHPALILQSVTAGSVTLPFAYQQGDKDCYTVTSAALQGAGLGGTFGNSESIIVSENWLVTACVDDPPDITRRVQYGCQGDRDCQEKPDGVFITTGVNFDLLAPAVRVRSVSSTRPACYVTEPTENVVRFTNEGTSPAEGLQFQILTDNSRGMGIDESTIVLTREDGSVVPAADITISNRANGSACLADQTRALIITLNNLALGIDETLDLAYNITTTCGCNSCDIRNKYWSQVRQFNYTDACGRNIVG